MTNKWVRRDVVSYRKFPTTTWAPFDIILSCGHIVGGTGKQASSKTLRCRQCTDEWRKRVDEILNEQVSND